MTAPLYVDFHILQDLPPSNINRDDNGTPKQAVYGGATRLRASSQSWKRATRKAFAARQDPAEQGLRTRRLQGLLTSSLVSRGIEAELASDTVTAALGTLKITPGKKAGESSYLLFSSRGQLDRVAASLAEALEQEPDSAKAAASVDVKTILGTGHSLDVALFGRMVADVTDLNVDAAAQVAHAISTHAAPTQFDYFTAVDDLQERDEPGAGMIGTVEFSSATLYRFATVGVHQLSENLADEAAAVEGVVEFARAFCRSMPSGHQTSFAPRTRPALVVVVVRADQPVNLVSAFERPVDAGAKGVMSASQRALASLYASETTRWGDRPVLAAASYAADGHAQDELQAAFGPSLAFEELLTSLGDGVRASLGHGAAENESSR